jgi:crotonobetainyl-CoA:carnitine CoA-transferase CaiB-like acyl-CoA transferase
VLGAPAVGGSCNAGPLDGTLVVDTSQGLAGAFAGMLLADHGATVVKIERGPASAPLFRSVFDRGKWSIERDAADASIAALLDRADVLLESDLDTVIGPVPDTGQRYPHLVHCRISGQGFNGPMARVAGHEALVAARLGMMAEQRGHRPGPIFLGHPSISYATGFLAVTGVLAALHARDALGGRGQFVETSLLDGALAVNAMTWWWNEHGLSYLSRTGTEIGFGRYRLINNIFECADGEFIMVHTGGRGGFKRATDLLGLGERVRTIEGLEASVPLDDDEHHVARHLAPAAFRTRPRDEWIRRFHQADLAALPVLRPEEVFLDDQVVHANVIITVDDPEVGTVRQVGPVVRFSRSPSRIPTPAPRVGEQNDRLPDLTTRVRKPNPGPGSLDREGRPSLEGLRVLDLSSFYATAFGARLLSELGADVVKVESPRGDEMRPFPDLFESAQRGKRNIALNLRAPESARVLRSLIESSDVVMHNLRPGKAERLGFGYEQCAAVNPRLIYCYLPGFGATGPKAGLKSFAPLISGFTGILYVGAGKDNPPTRVIGNEDIYNGFLGAMSVLSAVVFRDRTGEGQYIESPHLSSGLLFRSEQMTDGHGRPLPALELDRDQMGWGPLCRLYRTSDNWLVIFCPDQAAFLRLLGALGRTDLEHDPRFADSSARAVHGNELGKELEAVFAGLTTDDARQRLELADVSCEVPRDEPYMPRLLWDDWALETGRVFEINHPEYGRSREIGHCLRMFGTPLLNKGPSAQLGQHTREILLGLGYGSDEIEALAARGLVLIS